MEEKTRTLPYTKADGYQPKNEPKTTVPPTSGPAYKPIRKTTEEAVQELLDANIMLMNVIDQLHMRIKNVESDLRQALEKISRLENSDSVTAKCINAQADQLDRLLKEVFDEDPPKLEEL